MSHLQKHILSLLFVSLIASAVFSQEKPIQLFGEGGNENGKTILKLLWIPKAWQSDWKHFKIKSRSVSGSTESDWTPISRAPISPEISRTKDLTIIETDLAALARLKNKLEKWLSTGQLKEINREDYLRKLATDANAVKGLYIPIALDYDFALVNGFGMVVRQFEAAQGSKLEYGLFVVKANGQEQLVASYDWQYGSRPDLNLPVELKIIKTGSPSSLEVRWDFDYQSYLDKSLNGFNIYRSSGAEGFQKLNENPIWAATQGNTSQLSFFDKNVQPNTVYTYAVTPLTLFGTEGKRQEAVFDPSKLPGKVDPPVLRTIDQAVGTTGIRFAWDFQIAAQKFVRGFILQRRANVDAAYEDVSLPLTVSTRVASDTPPQQGEYFLYRIKVVDDFGLNLYSNELLIYYDPQIPPPPPTGLRGEYEKEGDRQFIKLNWDAKPQGDAVTVGYRLYSSFPPNEQLILEGNIPLITDNSYRYEVFSVQSQAYQFAVSAVSDHKAESERSNTVKVFTRSQKLPNTNIWPFSVSGNRITLNWTYESPPDLAGFRIFQDGKQVADESLLGSSSREWISPPLEFNASYRFELQAITTSRITSKKSVLRTITTEKKQ